MIRQLLLSVVFLPLPAFAYESVTFQTPQDKFTVVNSGGKFSVGGKLIQNDILKTLSPYLSGPVAEGCPSLSGRPQITAFVTNGGKTEKREFFIQRGVIRSGPKCVFATGDGLHYLPLHRNWLIGPARESVKLLSPVKVIGPKSTVYAHLVKQEGKWTDTKPRTELDWDFFDKFEQSLADYRVQYRISPAAARGKHSVALISGNRTYHFYKLAPKFWAIKRPGEKWLVSSGDWTFWFELDEAVWIDRRMPTIRKVEAEGTTIEEKLNLLRELDNTGWSRTLQEFYQRHMLDTDEDKSFRMKALERLRTKPSWENMGAFVQLVQSNPDDDFLKEATSALRTRNPKGTAFNGNNRATVVNEWIQWWAANKSRKD